MKPSKVQTLRGLACLMLVAYHVVGATDAQGMRFQSGWVRELMNALAAVRMPVFGLIAGAMYGYSHKCGWLLVQDKFKRLLIPMLTVGTGFALMQQLVPASNLPIEDLHLIHIVPVAHYWFLESLFLIFCMMAAVEKLYTMQTIIPWSISFAVSVLMYLWTPGFIWFGLLGAFYLLPYFLVGFGMTRLHWDAKQEHRQAGLILTLLGIGLIAGNMALAGTTSRFSPTMLLAGLSMACGLWSLGLRNAFLARIGDYSFAIFLFHVFFTSGTRMALQALAWDAHALVFLASMLTGIAGPILVKVFLMRYASLGFYFLGVPKTAATAT